MLLKSILNRIQRQDGCVSTAVHCHEHRGRQALDIEIQPRGDNRPICPNCGLQISGYDMFPVHGFEFVLL